MRRAIILCAALLTGCAQFEPHPVSPAKTAAELEARSLTNVALKTFLETNLHREFTNWPAQMWDFEMLTLTAFYYHPSLDVARAQWHVAQAGVKTAGGRPNPTLIVTPGYSANPATGISPWFPAVNFDIPIETAGKRGKRISVAVQLSEAARLNIATVAWKVRSNLRSTLLDVTAAHQRMMLLQGQVSAQEQIVKVISQKAELGDIASSELTLSHIAFAKALLDLSDAQRQLAEARANLAEAIGVPTGALDCAELSFDPLKDAISPAELTSADVRRVALQSRSDILRALAEYAAADATLRLEIAKQYPDVHLSPGYQFDQGENKWSLGISVDLPVLNRNQGPIAEAKARREESGARFNELQSKVMAEIERATAVFRLSEKNSTALQSLAADQSKQRTSIEARVKAGAAERLDFLNSQVESATSQLVLLDGQFKLQQAIGALEDAVQRPLTGDIFSAEQSPTDKEHKK